MQVISNQQPSDVSVVNQVASPVEKKLDKNDDGLATQFENVIANVTIFGKVFQISLIDTVFLDFGSYWFAFSVHLTLTGTIGHLCESRALTALYHHGYRVSSLLFDFMHFL